MTSTPQILIPNRYRVVPRTILFVFSEDKVLLQKGALNKKINPGLWNGLGGHIERNEDVFSAAKRELFEEAGIQCVGLMLCGTIMIDVTDIEGILLFVFASQEAGLKPIDSTEGKLAWFPVDRIPISEIVDDVPDLLDRVSRTMESGRQFHLLYSYGANGNRITTAG
jgi:8-oxo-dGTP diphosphatase